MDMILALVLAQDTLADALAKKSKALESEEERAVLAECPGIAEPADDVREIGISYHLGGKKYESQWVELTLKRQDRGWIVTWFQTYRGKGPFGHGDAGTATVSPSKALTRYVESGDRDPKLVEHLRAIPAVNDADCVTWMNVTIVRDSRRIRVSLMKEKGEWSVDHVDFGV